MDAIRSVWLPPEYGMRLEPYKGTWPDTLYLPVSRETLLGSNATPSLGKSGKPALCRNGFESNETDTRNLLVNRVRVQMVIHGGNWAGASPKYVEQTVGYSSLQLRPVPWLRKPV